MKKRVLVCGGREYGLIPRGVVRHTPAWIMARQQASSEQKILTKTLDALVDQIGLLIHGAAGGADELAKSWAQVNGIQTLPETPALVICNSEILVLGNAHWGGFMVRLIHAIHLSHP